MIAYESKESMFWRGLDLSLTFCAANSLPAPRVEESNSPEQFGTCAYYRNHVTTISVRKCAAVGYAGMQWSFPGHSVDRTPYGVLQHELGHHADWLRSDRRGAYFGDFSVGMRKRSGEAPLTSYCPNDAEWFAEMFRLFVTNPDLLARLKPRTHAEMLAAGFVPVFSDSWRDRLAGAPERTISSLERRVVR